jgi:hypothetical protein
VQKNVLNFSEDEISAMNRQIEKERNAGMIDMGGGG